MKKIKVRQTLKLQSFADVKLGHVTLNVTEFINNVTERSPRGEVIRSWPGSMGMPPHQLPTEGTMLVLRPTLWTRLCDQLHAPPEEALRGLERLIRGLFPTISAPCDTQDFSSGIDTVATGEIAVFLYDAVYDGVGLTETAFHHMQPLLERAKERLMQCSCEDDEGCFRCVRDPRKEQPSSKADTHMLIDVILEALSAENPDVVSADVGWEDQMTQTANLKCERCDDKITAKDRFCSNCGFKLGA